MTQTAQKELMEKSIQCVMLSRAINDQYPDRTKMPAEKVAHMKKLQAEAKRLRDLADLTKEQDELEAWSAEPDRMASALKVEGAAGADEIRKMGGEAWAEMQKARHVELFAKAIRYDKAERVAWLNTIDSAEKAALVENATGEVIVPHDIAGPIFKTLPHLGIFRSAGPTVRPTSSNKVDLRSLTNATAGWGKIEVNAGPPTDAGVAPNSPVDVVEVHDLMAMSQIGVDELADTDANLVALVQDIVGQVAAQMEDDAFAAGNGVSKPWGLAARATAASNQITQQVTATNSGSPTADDMKRLPYRVPSRFRTNGAYFASNDAAEAIALLKDTTSNYLWQPSVRAGEPDTFSGKRFYVLEGLPSMGASAAAVDPSVIFGDPSLGYLVADRQRITVQRLDERYAEQGLVAFIFKLRVGGDVMRPTAFAKYLL